MEHTKGLQFYGELFSNFDFRFFEKINSKSYKNSKILKKIEIVRFSPDFIQ